MNKQIGIFSTLLFSLLFQSCFLGISGSGVIEEIKVDQRDFTKIQVEDAFSITVSEGDDYDVTIHMDDNLIHRLDVRKNDQTLYIGLTNGNIRNATLKAEVVCPKLSAIKAKDATRAGLNGISKTNDLKLTAKDASKITGTVFVKNLEMKLSDVGRIELEGSADLLKATIKDASCLSLKNIPLLAADLRLHDASKGTITVSDTLSARLSDASSLFYYGMPKIKYLQTGDASTIKRKK